MAINNLKTSAPLGRRKLAKSQSTEQVQQATRDDILHAATLEFVAKGYDGASISSITSRTQTSQRMLYYHFGGKAQLYRAVLEAGYTRMFKSAPELNSDNQDPQQALHIFAAQTFDRHLENEDFVRLLMIENIAGATTVSKSDIARELGKENLAELKQIIQHGKKNGVFRSEIRVEDVYAIMAGMSFTAVSNRHTVKVLFGADLEVEAERDHRRQLIATAVCRFAEVV